MLFDLELIKSITSGAEKIIYEDSAFKFFRFTDEEAKITDNLNVLFTAGIEICFKTDGTVLNLSVETKTKSDIRSLFAFDILIDGKLVGDIKNYKESECVGNFAEKDYELGEFSANFDLGAGEKTVRIVFPYSCMGEIKMLEVAEASYVLPVKRSKSIIAYGDSITQGYDAEHPSKTYVMRLADKLDAEILNKGLGGETFSLKMPAVKNGNKPDFVIISYGTNDWWTCDKETVRKNADEFLSAIEKNYPGIKVFVITPIWRNNFNDITRFGKFSEVESLLRTVCENHKNVRVISGIDLVPKDETFFGDARLHPNDKGFKHYFENLERHINERDE